MTTQTQSKPAPATRQRGPGASFLRVEDWWAVGIGLLFVTVAIGLYAGGASLAWLAVSPPAWTEPGQLLAHFTAAWPRYLALLTAWLAVVALASAALGYNPWRAAAGFAFVYAVSVLILAAGQWSQAVHYNLEPPLVALLLGLLIANLGLTPAALEDGFRVEFYIKLGIVLMGATVPLSLIAWAGPVALAQAALVSVVTFGVIFAVARALGIEPRFAAVLGVGGAVCGVSAAIAIAAAVGARKQDVAVAISIVIVWAIVMIFALPFAADALHLPAGVGGAWIGTSEFADAAGLAAAQAYGGIAGHAPGAPAGAAEQAVAAFTLMKVVGRDMWVGAWALGLSIVAARYWDDTGISGAGGAGEVWRRFPKFVLGFFAASILVTLVAQHAGHAAYGKLVTPGLVAPLKSLRSWAFAFGFFSIGLTTRFSGLAAAGWRPVAAFSVGVAVNLPLGLVLSALVFGGYWAALGH